jgi:hypothetical protein
MLGLIGFLNPGIADRFRAYEEKLEKEALKDDLQTWDEDKTKFKDILALNASSYDMSKYYLFDTPPDEARKFSDMKHVTYSPSKQFAYCNRVLPARQPIELWQGHKRGKVIWSGKVVIPVLFFKDGTPYNVWMSCTPAEMLSQRQGIRRATGKVLIGGLGMGWFLRKVAEKKSVKEIIVVEKSQELLDWFGKDLCKKIAKDTKTKIKVICDDVLNHMGKHGKDTRHLIDIWKDYPNEFCYLSKEWQAAIERVDHFWGWGVIARKDY